MADSTTTQISISNALKLKKRLANQLAKLDTRICTYNSYCTDSPEYDVKKLYAQRMVLAERMVKLKVAISEANRPIQKSIFEIAECKAMAATLARIETKHGPQAEGYSGVIANYNAQFRKRDVDREIRKIEMEIDRIQDELDRFNFTSMIETEAATVPEIDF